MSQLPCPDCGTILTTVKTTTFACPACKRGFWMRGIELVRDTGESVRGPLARRDAEPRRRKHKPTPKKPVHRVPAAKVVAQPRDPASVTGPRAGIYCPDCRAELLRQVEPVSALACPGCGRGFWMRGAEVIREGEHEAIVVPDTNLPHAKATIRKRDDD